MDSKKITYSAGGGIGISTVVFIVFLILKLVGVINWSWWIIFLPLIVPYIFVGIVAVLMFGIVALAYKLQKSRRYF